MRLFLRGLAGASTCLTVLSAQGDLRPYRGWSAYGGGSEVMRYSALNQVNRANVAELEVAWTYDSGDATQRSQIESTPIMIDGVLYLQTPRLAVAALDPATGEERWLWTPPAGGRGRSRGLNYWTDGAQARIYAPAGSFLYAIDARTGETATVFGEQGRIDLREGLGRPPEGISVGLSTPGVIYRDLLIIGSNVSESLPAAPGDIRAFDVRTGRLRWTFHTIPRPGEFGYETWPPDAWKHSGGVNAWGGLSLDERRGLVFVPTGSATYDYYGGDRQGDNLFADSLVALNAQTGDRVWHQQLIRHDLWDRDLPAAPSLVTITRDGRRIDAVAQTTKSGHVFVFERDDGTPVFPLEEKTYPASDVPGEVASRTQMLPQLPPPFSRQFLSEDTLTRRTPEAHAAALETFRQMRSGDLFTPPSLQGNIQFPGFDGGASWGGAAFDPTSGVLFVNGNELPWLLQLGERRETGERTTVGAVYQSRCASCHGADMTGYPPDVPTLVGLGDRMGPALIEETIREGLGTMPDFAGLSDESIDGLVSYLATGEDRELTVMADGATPFLPYVASLRTTFRDPDGYPAITPPWGTLNAIDLNEGSIRWQVPLGEVPALVAEGMTKTGTPNFGGPVVTAGGLVFIGATTYDEKFRAFDERTGAILWETTLPAANFATPAVYEAQGRQFIVVAAGGGRGTPSKAVYVAFALPHGN